MKVLPQITHQQQQIIATLVLTGILSLGAAMTLINSAAAESVKSPQGFANIKQSNDLPVSVINAISRDISRSNNIPPGQLRVVTVSQKNWTDSCLGLGKLDESCGQVFIQNGWRVTMSDGRQTWVYRADNTGRIVRLENQSNPSSSNLPDSVADAVLQAASVQLKVSTSQLKITQSEQRDWRDRCLELGSPVELCASAITPGWRVTVESKQQRLVYHTNRNGSQVKLNKSASNISEADLPSLVSNAVLQAASSLTGLRTSDLRIVKSEQINTDGCLGLPRPGEPCTRINMQVWEVTVEGGRNTLVYRSTNNASQVRLNESASNIASANVPDAVSNAVLQFASGQLGVPTSRLRIVKSQQQTWQDSCLGLPRAVERCMGIVTQGWRVTVENRQQQQQQYVYRTNNTGSQVRAEDVANQPPGDNNLPSSVAKAVLEDASKQSNLSVSRLRIVQSEQREWSDGCLGLPDRGRLCTQALVSGWRVTVEGDRQTYIYRTNASGSLVKLETGTTAGSGDAVRMSSRELPPPLTEGVVFRAIASGGIVGNTIETVLMNDGQVIRRFNNSRIKNPVQTHQISRQELRQFLQLLDKERFSQFNQLSYPAPRGSADTISVTLTSQSCTTRFTDASSERLPDNLKSVIQAWSQIANRR
ncbi:MAG: hypothetical protein U7123_05740 [Potamolinea sp.]